MEAHRPVKRRGSHVFNVISQTAARLLSLCVSPQNTFERMCAIYNYSHIRIYLTACQSCPVLVMQLCDGNQSQHAVSRTLNILLSNRENPPVYSDSLDNGKVLRELKGEHF
jgi:hypothetical protein